VGLHGHFVATAVTIAAASIDGLHRHPT